MFYSCRLDIQEITLNNIYEIKLNIKIGDKVKSNDIIGYKINNLKKEEIKSKYISFGETVVKDIKEVIIDNEKIIRIYYIRYDILNVGDKLSSRYSQKGVIGKIESDINLPYISNGICPDIIINPHSFPSRMTIGHIIETVKSIEGIRKNKYINSTGFSFEKISDNDFFKKKYMYNKHGNIINDRVSIGFCYYQMLKHQVIEKIYSMTSGCVNVINKQPINGKSNKGGLRLGELDKDCLIAHGVTSILYEKFIYHSDWNIMRICKKCHNIKYNECLLCNEDTDHDTIITTNSFKILCDFLKGLNINVLIIKN